MSLLESADPPIEAVGITDYLVTRRYKTVKELREKNGRLSNVLLFCNIEMRLSIETKTGQGVNVHILVDPAPFDHLDEVERFLGKLTFRYNGDSYSCAEPDLRKLGRAFDSSIKDDEAALKAGINQFKADFRVLRQLYEESDWMRANTLIAVAASSKDGTAGLQADNSAFAAQRKEIESFADIIFTGTPKTIAFWRGDGVLSVHELEQQFRGPKPCLHGSDAHGMAKVAHPDDDRFCWIKGDATFDSLRQACTEPRMRACVAEAPPDVATPFGITSIATPTLPWLLPKALPLNPGMIAIIGARGSGKTALADLIAHAGDSGFALDGDQSFLRRAQGLLGAAAVHAEWSDGSTSERPLRLRPYASPEVHYLTQQFVDRLCSSIAESDELLEEIKRVVFLAHEPESRLGADTFDALVELKSTETQLAVDLLNQRLDRLSGQIQEERGWHSRRSALTQELAKIKDDLAKTDAARKILVKPGGRDRADYYNRLSSAIAEREQLLQALRKDLQSYSKLIAETARYRSELFPHLQAELRRPFADLQMSEEEWQAFLPTFSGDPDGVLLKKVAAQEQKIAVAQLRLGRTPDATCTSAGLSECALASLQAEQTKLSAEINADERNLQRLRQLSKSFSTQDATRVRLERECAHAGGSPERLKALLNQRAGLYGQYFDLVIEQCSILEQLYAPLAAKLQTASPTAQKLGLKVVRSVDIDAWANAGENLIDLRKAGEFKGKGTIADAARSGLLAAWQGAAASEVVGAMDRFRQQYDQALIKQARAERGTDEFQQWVIDLGRWLYSTDHIDVRYVLEYEGVPIAQLSPGTRGIVLLLLYLALDLEDSRPLLIDQPEENLDPKSIYSELIQLFSEARGRRQVIIVTHNANLVVNTDVDQVIVASCTKGEDGEAPQFAYESGGLEDAGIRAHVCEILEGGEAAFRQRAKRLRLDVSK